MLRITPSTATQHAKSYFTSNFARADYYAGKECVGIWHGKAAAMLGLQGDITREAFFALCDNLHPQTGETLTARQRENRTVGYDFTFCAPKSVSLLYSLTEDPRILEAYRHAVTDTMGSVEGEMLTRIRKGGITEQNRTTGNAVWAEFVHTTTRPVDGLPDPSLHTHCFVFNCTHDPIESRFKAGQFRELKRDGSYFEAMFHAHLSLNLRQLGYEVQREGKWWNVAGLPKALLEQFSRRTEQIEAKAEALGILDAKTKSTLGARTREAKGKTLPPEVLRRTWWESMSPDHRTDFLAVVAKANAATGGTLPPSPMQTKQAIESALSHCLERNSVVDRKTVLAEAMRRGTGVLTPEAIHQELAAHPLLTTNIGGRTYLTTHAALAEEQAMIQFAKEGRGTCKPIAAADIPPPSDLSTEQANALAYLLHSTDRVMVITGEAGTGKTTPAKQAVAAMEQSGKQVCMVAPSSHASRDVLRKEGFTEANTVAKLLTDTDMQHGLKDGVLWVDEAGLLSVPQMQALFKLAKTHHARVVLVGDSKQHASVERGDGLRVLGEYAGIKGCSLTHIYRQKDPFYKCAVAAAARGDLTKAFDTLHNAGHIQQAADIEGVHQQIAADYVQSATRGDSCIVVAPTHVEGSMVSQSIRSALKAKGVLQGQEMTLSAIRPQHWTQTQKQDTAQYEVGMILSFHQKSGRFRAGDQVRVSRVDAKQGQIWVSRLHGAVSPTALSLDKTTAFSVHRLYSLALAVGDQIRITQNCTAIGGERLYNGAGYTVTALDNKTLRLSNGATLPTEAVPIVYGYSTTSHAAQGKTVDRVLIAQTALSLPASSAEQFYVSISRGREAVKVYTDNTDALKAAIAERNTRMSATEMFASKSASRLQRFTRYAHQLAKQGVSFAKDTMRGLEARFRESSEYVISR